MVRRSSRLQSKTPAPKPIPDLHISTPSPPLSPSSDEFPLDDEVLRSPQAGDWSDAFVDSSSSEPSSLHDVPQGRWDKVVLSSSHEACKLVTRSPGDQPVDSSSSESSSSGGWDGAFLSSPDQADRLELRSRSPEDQPISPPPDSPDTESEPE